MSISQQTAAKYGFIVMVEEGALFGTLSGMNKEILHEFSAEHPMKQLRELRLVADTAAARLAWVNYERKIAELANQLFIDQDTMQPNVSGLILAGCEFLMEALCQSGMLDPTLRDKVLCRALVSYAGDSGFNDAIDLSSKYLGDVEFVQEKRLVRKFFAEAMASKGGDPWNCVFGVKETLKALESGAVKSLMVCENMDISRYITTNSVTGEISIQHFDEIEEKNDQRNLCHLTCNEEPGVNDNQFPSSTLQPSIILPLNLSPKRPRKVTSFAVLLRGLAEFCATSLAKRRATVFRDIFLLI